jgi:hypothetical protein
MFLRIIDTRKHASLIGKEETAMATNTFERKIELQDPESIKKLIQVMDQDAPKQPLSQHPYTAAERDRSEQLFRQCLSRSRH